MFEEETEALGPRLTSMTAWLMRSAVDDRIHAGFVPEGPHFNYGRSAGLFPGRVGMGPLVVAWDTNLLVDYFTHGRALWDGISLPDELSGEYGEELEGLQLVIGLWVVRDIRFRLFDRVITDAKRELSADRQADRQRAVDQFAEAIAIAERYDEEDEIDRARPNQDAVTQALRNVPAGADRDLLSIAVHQDVHVFLTRDKGVLRCAPDLRPLGLVIASPLELLEELVGCGAYHCLFDPRYAYWPVPDLSRVPRLVSALPK